MKSAKKCACKFLSQVLLLMSFEVTAENAKKFIEQKQSIVIKFRVNSFFQQLLFKMCTNFKKVI